MEKKRKEKNMIKVNHLKKDPFQKVGKSKKK